MTANAGLNASLAAPGALRVVPALFLIGLIALSALPPLRAQTGQAPPAAPAHRVRLAPGRSANSNAGGWYPAPVTTVEGRVVQWDGEQIAIELRGERAPTRYASERVLSVESSQIPADQAKAIGQFKQGQYSEALTGLIRSISDRPAGERPAVWRQQWISMLAAQAAMRTGRGEIALELVRQLDARPLPARILGLLPVDWAGDLPNDSPLMQAAVKQAASESTAVKLVTASWLIRSPKYQAAATDALRRLADQRERPHIAALAGQLLWRTKSPPEIETGVRAWERELETLPMTLQTGPAISIRSGLRRAGLNDAARRWALNLETAAANWHPDLPPESRP